MANKDRPRGLFPVRHLGGGVMRSNAYRIASGYAADILRGDPVKMAAGGTVERAAAEEAILGIFDGCEYTDAQGVRQFSPHWPDGATATDEVIAYVYDDPMIAFGIQADGAITAADVGACADVVAGAGDIVVGVSGYELSSTTGSASAQCKIIGKVEDPENDWGVNADVLVIINEHFLKQTAGV